MALIACEDLTLGYEGLMVVKDLNFEIQDQDYLCIIGENGAGKSTLVSALLGLKSPVSGKVMFGDGLKQNEIGYVAQRTEVQKDFPASVDEVVLSGCLNARQYRPFYSRKERQRAIDAMKTLQIAELRYKCFSELSGGQQQRVLLARAMCATKRLFLLDEPVTGLDALMTTEFFELVKYMNKTRGITIVMVSHDIHCAVKYAKHILHLNHDKSFYGTTDDYVKSEIGKRFIGGHRHD